MPGTRRGSAPGSRRGPGPSRGSTAGLAPRDGTACRARVHARIAGRAQQRVRTGAPARGEPARRACVAAKARVTTGTCTAAVTWVTAEAWVTGAQVAVPARVRTGAEVTAPARLVPPIRIGPAIQVRIFIGAGGGPSPARVPRGPRTAVAHAPSPVPDTSLAAATTCWKSLHHEAPAKAPPPFRPGRSLALPAGKDHPSPAYQALTTRRSRHLPERDGTRIHGSQRITFGSHPRTTPALRNHLPLLPTPPEAAIPEPRRPSGTTSRVPPISSAVRQWAAVDRQTAF